MMGGREPPAGTGPGLVHSWVFTLQLHPPPVPDWSEMIDPEVERFTLTKPVLGAVPPLCTVIVSVPVPPETKGLPPSETLSTRSTGVLDVTGVVIDDELFDVVTSLEFETVVLSCAEPPGED